MVDDVRARKLAADLKQCSYYETCATYGLNVERVFQVLRSYTFLDTYNLPLLFVKLLIGLHRCYFPFVNRKPAFKSHNRIV